MSRNGLSKKRLRVGFELEIIEDIRDIIATYNDAGLKEKTMRKDIELILKQLEKDIDVLFDPIKDFYSIVTKS